MGIIFFLTVILFSVLGRLTKPLSELEKGAAEIAEGCYSHTIEVKGHNEIAKLGKQFNEMNLKIN